MKDFEPKIIGFLCNWCSYAGADLAGISRIKYAPNVRIIRVLCSGRVDPSLIVTAFEKGADGVLVTGCHPGDCHYISGNYQAEKKVENTRKILKAAGVDEKRLGLEWISAAEGQRFADIINEFTEKIRSLGPSNVDPQKIVAAREEASDFRVRWLVGRENDMLEGGNAFGEETTREEFENFMDDVIETQYVRSSILTALRDEPLSVKDLSETLKIPSDVVLKNLVQLSKGQRVQIVEGHPLRYEVIPW